jgi:hypothetical protein
MNPLEDLEQVGDCAFFRPAGQSEPVPLPDRLKQLLQVVALAHARHIPKLLMNLTRLEHLEMPNVADRYFIMREFAAVAKGAVKIAFVLPPHLIGDRFGVLVGRNAGLMSDVFTDEPTAIAWLNSESQP